MKQLKKYSSVTVMALLLSTMIYTTPVMATSAEFKDDLKAAVFIFIGINIVFIVYGASYAFLKYSVEKEDKVYTFTMKQQDIGIECLI
jgi:hypothetical protein